MSTDGGTTFTFSTDPSSRKWWLRVVSNADFTKLYGIASDGYYISTDSGATWSAAATIPSGVGNFAGNADLSKMLAIGSSFKVFFYLSLDSAATWVGDIRGLICWFLENYYTILLLSYSILVVH